MATSLLPPLLAASVALPVLPAAAGGPFAWSLVLSGAVVVLSLIPLGAARSQADFTPSDLAAPRAMFERLPAWGKRANWAHQNSFEAFTLHAPACLLCLLVAPSVLAAAPWVPLVAWLHPALRLGYIGAYVANVPPVRSLCWAGGILCTALLYSEGLRAVLRS
ncbi:MULTISPECIES: MAPEG family protein [Cyanophyceae]|uniref:MAPEG family protein n=1 Tax=Aphanothece cf. minutissima CCALA 015 TaxID=2107695 RepID=A0ABX5F5G3_9CHRO|nr:MULTISPECIES: MAPEG family protein [Cyanophyceae]PSB36530.1 MAPEG family protein [Aphanothece cf. minutissima CCALA 015]